MFGIFWVVHLFLCGDFSCSYICESALDGGKEIVVGLRIIDQQSSSPPLKKKRKKREILSFSLSFATAEIGDYVVHKLLVDMVCV